MPNRQLNILLVEDSPSDAFLTREALAETGGFLVTQASRLSEAIELLDERAFDGVLLDLGLPDSDGLGGFHAVHQQSPRTPVVVLTGQDDYELALEAVQAGAQDYLVKGKCDSAELARALRYAAERRRLESELRDSEQRFRLLSSATTDVIGDWDIRARTLWLSEGITRLVGANVKPSVDWWMESLHDDDRERVVTSLTNVIRSDRDAWVDEYRLRRHDGSWAVVLHKGQVVSDRKNKAIRMVGGVTDLTERRNLETQLFQSQKMEAIGALAGGVAHDFNNLLMIINGNVNLLLSTPASSADRSMLADIRDAGERAAALTRQLLAFSRKQILTPRVLDLNHVVRDVEKLLRRLIGEHIEIVLDLDNRLPSIRIDPAQLEQLLINLCINARDAMPAGGRLTIRTITAASPGAGLNGNGRVSLIVADTGTGIPPEVLPRIFEPFFTTKPSGRGTGLGLSMVSGIVSQSDGTIEVQNNPEGGARFCVSFPGVVTRPQSAARQRSELPHGSETVLVVEDEEGVRSVIRRTLESLGYRVLIANGGRDALELFDRNEQDVKLLLTDVVMPGMVGSELVARLRSRNSSLRVLYMSGYMDDEVLRSGLDDKSESLLEKPFSIATLAGKVREALSASPV